MKKTVTETKLLKIDEKRIDRTLIRFAADAIRKGLLVAFPTETVYGLGVDTFNSTAVKSVFEAKGRPYDNPLIVHVANKDAVDDIAVVNKEAKILMDAFWPGPLTLVLKKKNTIPSEVTVGLKTVAVRMPSNKIARELILAAKVPIAAPSANISGKPSPTSADHVIKDLFGKADIIIDGGPCSVGVESTVLDVSKKPAVLLRPGGITLEELESFIKIKMSSSKKTKPDEEKVRSPGMKYRHYSPEAKLILVEGDFEKIDDKIELLSKELTDSGKKVGIIASKRLKNFKAHHFCFVGRTKTDFARNLFASLREMDVAGVDVIIAQGISEKGMGLAVMNRLRKAATTNITV